MKYPSDSNHFQKKYAPKPDLPEARKKKREEYEAKPAAVKAREAEENGLINQQYYEEIAAEMEALLQSGKQPTLEDEILAMSKQGNALYFKNFKGFSPEAREDEFKESAHLTHEISHLSASAPQTAQGEAIALAFEGGLNFGLAIRQLDKESVAAFRKGAEEAKQNCSEAAQQYQQHAGVDISNRSWAIYMAAGMYLREKMDSYLLEGMNHNKTYQQQLEWCQTYEQRDHVPTYEKNKTKEGPVTLSLEKDFTKLDEQNEIMYWCYEAPSALIHLSKKEWRAIEAVALNLHRPDQTPYPERMKAIKEALVHVGMQYDLPKALEARQLEKMTKGQNAKIKGTYASQGDYESWKKFKAERDAQKAQQNLDERSR